ncbi:MAG: hypothetical protein A2V90_07710 [Gammaproteobacteria bacterium RBG_16_57_12]|nr:MAG: hypothetical protein A2V90_07710 [Gammaproteobacteria bacterium RBG_16_57_12]
MVVAGTIPNCVSYDPTFSYELAVIIHDGLHRMYEKQERIFYYVTTMNENYTHPAMPDGAEEGIVRGLYLFRAGGRKKKKVQLIGSGAILREVIAAADLLAEDWGVDADIWSATSFNELVREARDTDRWNRLHPAKKPKTSYVSQCFADRGGPFVAATDYIQSYAEQIRKWVPGRYEVLGTDGFGRSDTRAQLRKHFEVNRYHVAVTALKALADDGLFPAAKVSDALKKYGIDPEKPNPLYV